MTQTRRMVVRRKVLESLWTGSGKDSNSETSEGGGGVAELHGGEPLCESRSARVLGPFRAACLVSTPIAQRCPGAGSHAERNLHRWVKMLFGNPLAIYQLWLDLDSPQDDQRIATQVPTLPLWEIMHALYQVARRQPTFYKEPWPRSPSLGVPGARRRYSADRHLG